MTGKKEDKPKIIPTQLQIADEKRREVKRLESRRKALKKILIGTAIVTNAAVIGGGIGSKVWHSLPEGNPLREEDALKKYGLALEGDANTLLIAGDNPKAENPIKSISISRGKLLVEYEKDQNQNDENRNNRNILEFPLEVVTDGHNEHWKKTEINIRIKGDRLSLPIQIINASENHHFVINIPKESQHTKTLNVHVSGVAFNRVTLNIASPGPVYIDKLPDDFRRELGRIVASRAVQPLNDKSLSIFKTLSGNLTVNSDKTSVGPVCIVGRKLGGEESDRHVEYWDVCGNHQLPGWQEKVVGGVPQKQTGIQPSH